MENENQDVSVAVLSTKLENISKDLAVGFGRSEAIFKMFEEKNCRKHQEILATTNKYRGELTAEMDKIRKEIKDCYVTKEEAKPTMDFFASVQSMGGKMLLIMSFLIFGLVAFVAERFLKIGIK